MAASRARHGVKQVMRIDRDGTVQMTPALAKRMHFEITPAPKVELTAPL